MTRERSWSSETDGAERVVWRNEFGGVSKSEGEGVNGVDDDEEEDDEDDEDGGGAGTLGDGAFCEGGVVGFAVRSEEDGDGEEVGEWVLLRVREYDEGAGEEEGSMVESLRILWSSRAME